MKDDDNNIVEVEQSIEQSQSTPASGSAGATAPQEIHIVVNRHKQFFDMLKRPRQMWRAMLLLFAIVVVLFLGLAFVTFIIKSMVPYNVVRSNQYGALIMGSESNDVYHFMYNPAVLWANSGIEVKKGQAIDIKASGNFNSTVHYLVEKNIDAEWLTADGAEAKNPRDQLLYSTGCFILPTETPEKLLCAIVDPDRLPDVKERSTNYAGYIDSLCKCIEDAKSKDAVKAVGIHHHITAKQDGVLLFAVNDIVYTGEVKGKIDSLANIKEFIKENWVACDSDIVRFTKRPDAWYLDNVGTLLITVEIPR